MAGPGPTSARLIGSGRTSAIVSAAHVAGFSGLGSGIAGGAAGLTALGMMTAGAAGAAGGVATMQGPATPVSSGLRIRLKADAGVATSGSNVTTWTDQASGIVFASAGVDSPVLLSSGSGINGQAAIRFTNASGSIQKCYLQATVDMSTWAGITLVYIARTAGSGTIPTYASVLGVKLSGVRWSFGNGGDAGADLFGVGAAGTNANVGLGNYSPALTNGQALYEAYQYDKSTWTMSGQRSGTAADTSFPSGTTTFIIGSADFSGSQNNGDIAEILVYDHKLSASDLAWNRNYGTVTYAV